MSLVGMLDGLTSDYETFDALSDPEVREGIKEFSNWPTIPQLYVNGEFMGGSDIVQEIQALIRAGEDFQLIDVRSPEERERAVIEGSRHLDRNTAADLEKLPADRRVVFYCHTGQRSQVAARGFAANGHQNVYNLVGGIDAWSTEIDPQVPRY